MIFVVLCKWCLVVTGVVWFSSNLFKAKQFVWLVLFLFAIAFGVWGLGELFQYLSQDATGGFTEELSPEALLSRYIGLFTDCLALWVLYRLFKRRVALDKLLLDQPDP